MWLGRLRDFANYAALLKWSLASREAGHALQLHGDLSELRFDPSEERIPPPLWLPQKLSRAQPVVHDVKIVLEDKLVDK